MGKKSEFDRIKEVLEYLKTWSLSPDTKVDRKKTDEYVDVLIYQLEHVIKKLNTIKSKEYADDVIDILLSVDERLLSIRGSVEDFVIKLYYESLGRR